MTSMGEYEEMSDQEIEDLRKIIDITIVNKKLKAETRSCVRRLSFMLKKLFSN